MTSSPEKNEPLFFDWRGGLTREMNHEPSLTASERTALSRWRWFASLSPAARHDLLRHSAVRRYRSGDVIIARDAKTSDWLGCASGAVRIGTHGPNGKKVVLTYVQAGVWFAGPGLFDNGPSTHEALACGKTTILSIAQADFTALLSASAELCVAVLRLQARHIRELYEALEAVNTLPLRRRLAKQLVSLAQRHGVPAGTGGSGTRIGIRMAQDDLAQLVGFSRQRINFELKQMERAGVIRVERQGLVICDPDSLVAEVNAQSARAGVRHLKEVIASKYGSGA